MAETDEKGETLAENVESEDDDAVIDSSADALRVPPLDSEAHADAEDDIMGDADVEVDRVGKAADIVIVDVAKSDDTAESVRDSREDTESVGVSALEREIDAVAGTVNSELNVVEADEDTVMAAERVAESWCKDGETREVLEIEPDTLSDADGDSESTRSDADASGDALAS